MSRFMELDPTKAKTYQARERLSLVSAVSGGKAYRHGMSMGEFFLGLPNVLKAKDLLEVAAAIALAKKNGRPVIAMFGGHVVKCGCVPFLLDLAKDGFITHFASNGAAAIHDTELALCGHTSEDVAAQIEDGSFGMAADTADVLNHAASRARLRKEGFGEALGALLAEKRAPYDRLCLSVQAARLNIPYTVHVALGTDIVHQHPSAVGADIGDASLRDFRIFAASVSRLEGGVILNLGSAVIMPEVFLKALSLARNLKFSVKNFTAVNMDMIQHYRPRMNVVTRPVQNSGRGYAITGHHEIMIPLLGAAVREFEAGTLHLPRDEVRRDED
ncbi:hypothetical protein [Pyramidobacter sp.]|uniref:hypothetical protein n=1 Tax=Pyramidobacter sp. TaxID=1943581 RepID=UPI0025E40A77|nr:hypothetical protein [Pyramidobacter sp.]MCI7403858.1 hypothetical protein [Pyramidobacter sp.]MDY3212583.1 hypothetical protein [Pyramidobacter sp.]